MPTNSKYPNRQVPTPFPAWPQGGGNSRLPPLDLKFVLLTFCLFLLNAIDAVLSIPHFEWEINPLALSLGIAPFMTFKLALIPIVIFLLFIFGIKRYWVKVAMEIVTLFYFCVVLIDLYSYLR